MEQCRVCEKPDVEYSCSECREPVCEDCFDELAEHSCLVCAEDLRQKEWEDSTDDEDDETEPE